MVEGARRVHDKGIPSGKRLNALPFRSKIQILIKQLNRTHQEKVIPFDFKYTPSITPYPEIACVLVFDKTVTSCFAKTKFCKWS